MFGVFKILILEGMALFFITFNWDFKWFFLYFLGILEIFIMILWSWWARVIRIGLNQSTTVVRNITALNSRLLWRPLETWNFGFCQIYRRRDAWSNFRWVRVLLQLYSLLNLAIAIPYISFSHHRPLYLFVLRLRRRWHQEQRFLGGCFLDIRWFVLICNEHSVDHCGSIWFHKLFFGSWVYFKGTYLVA